MLPPDNLTPQARLFLAILCRLQQSQTFPPTSPPPPYTIPTPTATITTSATVKPTLSTTPPTIDEEDDFDTEISYSQSPPLHIRISSPTIITGSNNRLTLPSPTHLSSLVSIAVKHALQGEEGEARAEGQRMAVTVDAETRIKGDGNVIINYGRKDNVGSHGNGTSDELSNLSMREGMGEGGGRRKRAISEPIDMQRVAKRIQN